MCLLNHFQIRLLNFDGHASTFSRKPEFYDTSIKSMIHAATANTVNHTQQGIQWLIMKACTYFREHLYVIFALWNKTRF